MDPDRPEIAQQVGEQALNSDSGEEEADEEDDRPSGQKRERDDRDAGPEHKPCRSELSYEENAKRFKKGNGGAKSDESTFTSKPKEHNSVLAKEAFGIQRKCEDDMEDDTEENIEEDMRVC
jgi:hypothetical protein